VIKYAGIDMPPPPFMEPHEIEAFFLLLRTFDKPAQALEWGSGASTFYYGSRLYPGSLWHAIEHETGFWFEQTSYEANRWGSDRIVVSQVVPNIPKKSADGYDEDFAAFRNYVLFPTTLGRQFDLILVDGRARIACMAVGWELLRDDGVMILHDAERPEYLPGIPTDCYQIRLSAYSARINGPVELLLMAKKADLLVRLERQLRRAMPPQVSISSNLPPAAPAPRIFFLNTFYQAFMNDLYARQPELNTLPYYQQKRILIDTCFGDSDFYSACMASVGWEADELIINASQLQKAWALEHGCPVDAYDVILFEQIREFKPDVLYLQDLSPATEAFIAAVRPFTRLIVGQIASPIPEHTHLQGFDIIISSFPHFVERFRQQGITAYYQPLAFDPTIISRLPQLARDIPVSFVGSISTYHGAGLTTLETIAHGIHLDVWGYGAHALSPDSQLGQRHHGEAWGLQMFSLLASSKITINRHIDVAENYANNMRLFEATGSGALLLTDYRDNLGELFEIGKEVVAYRTPEEAVLLARYYLHHPDKAAAIAKAGQERTLQDHTYCRRMQQTAEILEHHLRYLDEQERLPAIDYARISYDYHHLQQDQVVPSMEQGWQDTAIPFRQRALVQVELEAMYHGHIPQPFQVIAELLRPVVSNGMDLLEIGCASGYYSEAIQYLLSKQINYTGVDYSAAMISMAQNYYPQRSFMVADGAQLPFGDRSFSLVVSGCILLHTPDYAKHIAETTRVAKTWIAVHRTPVCKIRPTHYLSKMAYEVETVELRFNEQELLYHFIKYGFELEQSLVYTEHPEQDLYEVSYLLKRTATNHTAITPAKPHSIVPDHCGPIVLVSRAIAFTFPLSYAYLAGQLRSQGEKVSVLFKDIPFNQLVRQIMDLNPLLVGFGSLYPELEETRTLIRMLDEAGRRFPIVIGGQMVSPTPEFAVRITGADYGVIGEGELILAELVTRLRNGSDVSDLKGLVIREGKDIRNNGPGACIENLSTGLPQIPYDLFPIDQWLFIGEWYARNLPQPQWQREDRAINVHGGRGCPFTCNFCYHHSKARYRDISVMLDEAQEELLRFNGNMLYFSDDLALASPNRVQQLITAISALDRPISFTVSTRFDILAKMHTELLRDLKRAGCRTMGLGLESGSDRILKLIGKNCTTEQIEDGLERLHAVGIYPSTSIMVGQHTETLEDAAASIALMQRAVRRDPSINFAFTLATPFPGSGLYDLIFEKGLLVDEQEFYDRYFSTEGDFKQVVNLSEMSDIEVAAARYEIARIYFKEKARQKPQ
jgi:radical SAM superfamily enzyme YgiQ (UPF0313 family)/SAM-dependent methyltransferase